MWARSCPPVSVFSVRPFEQPCEHFVKLFNLRAHPPERAAPLFVSVFCWCNILAMARICLDLLIPHGCARSFKTEPPRH